MVDDRFFIRDLVRRAINLSQSEHVYRERVKLGDLRVGTGGLVTDSGHILAGCPRQALLRMEGIIIANPEEGKLREPMFEAGRANEDIWAERVRKTWVADGFGTYRREEECQIEWFLPSGRKVTGRPDIVLYDTKDNPKVGLELKLVSSVWTARDILLEGRPKYAHLIQAAHYSAKLGCRFELWYSCRADYALPEMAIRLCPKMGEPGSEYIEYAPYKKILSKKGNYYNKRLSWEEYDKARQTRERDVFLNPLKILPFEQGYQLGWDRDGYLWYQMITDHPSERVETDINWAGIERFYQLVDQMIESGDLGPRPLTVKGDGSKAGYSMCDYCPIASICDGLEKKKESYQIFIEAVKEVAVQILTKV